MMEDRKLNGDSGEESEESKEARLLALLRDLVETEGKMNAARVLGVNYRTLKGAARTCAYPAVEGSE